MFQNHTKQFLQGIILFFFSSFGNAEQAFFIPVGELTPSEKQAQSLPYLVRQANTQIENKTKTYADLKHYFREHRWIAVMLDYEAKNEDAYKQNANGILDSLPAGSYRNMVRLKSVPSMNLEITQQVQEILFQNKKIKYIHIDRETSSY